MENFKLVVFDAGNVIIKENSGGMMRILKDSCSPGMFGFLQSNLMLGTAGFSEANLEKYHLENTEFGRNFEELTTIESHKKLMPPIFETISLINQLQGLGVKVRILSNATIWMRDYVKTLVRVPESYFSCDLQMVKPDVRLYRLAFEGYHSSRIAYIDDREKNVIAANSLGANGFLFDPEKPEKLRSFLGL